MNKNIIKSFIYYIIGLTTITLGIIYSEDMAFSLFYDSKSIYHIPITNYQIIGIIVFFSVIGLTFILSAILLFIKEKKIIEKNNKKL